MKPGTHPIPAARALRLALVAGLILVGPACQGPGTTPHGTSVLSPSPAPSGQMQRIVSLAPSVTEILFALGAGPRVVACTGRCNYPPEVSRLPRIGDLHLDFERIVAMRPDLVVAEGITPARDVRRLQSLGLRVLQVDSGTLQGYHQTLERLGRELGLEAAASRLSADLEKAVASLRRRTTGLEASKRPRVFVEIQAQPLVTVGGGTFIDEVVTLAGGRNIFADLKTGYPMVDPEGVVGRDPEVVILTASTEDQFRQRPAFAGLAATRRGGIHAVNPDLLVRPSPRLKDGLAILAGWLLPPGEGARP